ncbi:ATP-dependent protease La domain-containing protein [Mucor mucedo]|uniref:ATP-dependent protease La domain-containing protein n=1 Tax=Mucor mucedo TaxID=29922 RepID=UPI00221EB007|nr:ATP-dependent protease La domain-containing protein [Mucor mucedo]KAI7896684.1 ATP-dependent protease La domain-containing protein [Mucor mucedo]
MTDRFNFTQSLTCVACGDILADPITLSCGYTVCSHCFPVSSPTSVKKSVFRCPVPHCESATHLFGPELLADVTVTELTNILRKYLPNCSLPPSPCSEIDTTSNSTDLIATSVIPLLQCHSCTSPVVDPITTPCGHTYCRLCILQSKIDTDQCNTCYRPLPKFSNLLSQAPNHLISRLVKDFQLSGLLPCNTRETALLDSVHLQQNNVPLFISGKVILPGQSFRLPIYAPNHLRMFRDSLIPSSRYNGLCLAAVHRSRPQVAQFGTILQIIGVEHHNDAIIIDVVGVDRFKLDTHQEEDETTLVANFEILHEASIRQLSIEIPNSPSADDHLGLQKQHEQVSQYAVDLADTVLRFIQHLSQQSTMPAGVLHTQTAGLLGPLWFESMKALHGPMPSKLNPTAVCWWAAVVLPVAHTDLYLLLRTIPIIDRLELVISWMQNLQSQWERCRSSAIHAFSQVPQQL